jgi:hypothetical protein
MHTYDNKFVIDEQSSLYLIFNEDDQDNYNHESRHSIESSRIVRKWNNNILTLETNTD